MISYHDNLMRHGRDACASTFHVDAPHHNGAPNNLPQYFHHDCCNLILNVRWSPFPSQDNRLTSLIGRLPDRKRVKFRENRRVVSGLPVEMMRACAVGLRLFLAHGSILTLANCNTTKQERNNKHTQKERAETDI